MSNLQGHGSRKSPSSGDSNTDQALLMPVAFSIRASNAAMAARMQKMRAIAQSSAAHGAKLHALHLVPSHRTHGASCQTLSCEGSKSSRVVAGLLLRNGGWPSSTGLHSSSNTRQPVGRPHTLAQNATDRQPIAALNDRNR